MCEPDVRKWASSRGPDTLLMNPPQLNWEPETQNEYWSKLRSIYNKLDDRDTAEHPRGVQLRR